MAVTLSYGRQREGYDAWKAAFQQGYGNIRAWPIESERTVETLMAARSVMFINYVARIDPSPKEYIDQRCKGLVDFMDLKVSF